MRTFFKKIWFFCLLALVSLGAVFCYFVLAQNKDFLDKTAKRIFNPTTLSSSILLIEAEKKAQKTILPDFSSFSSLLKESKADFIEANLAALTISFYKNGKEELKAGILKRGDEYSWGGTAAGFYKIERGYKTAFSAIAEVYMPYAMNFYGKYYLHGEPYYPSGAKMISDASGGCLQVKDETAKEFFESAELKMPFVVIDKENDGSRYERATTSVPEISSASFLVADLGSGEVLAEKNSGEQKQIASLTKLMTAVVLSENVDLRKTIRVNQTMLDLGFGETDSIKEGDYFDVADLFYPLLIESSNDAAEALASFLGRIRTVNLMNEKAKAILMPNTSFTCPSGYDEGNISTAQDLFYLARYVLNNRPLLFDISRSKEVPGFGREPFDIDLMWNKNVFATDETFVGGKTGYIETSGYNGLFVFKFEERNIAFVLLDTPHLDEVKSNTQKLYLWVRDNFFNN